jgi:hypothetical protein
VRRLGTTAGNYGWDNQVLVRVRVRVRLTPNPNPNPMVPPHPNPNPNHGWDNQIMVKGAYNKEDTLFNWLQLVSTNCVRYVEDIPKVS